MHESKSEEEPRRSEFRLLVLGTGFKLIGQMQQCHLAELAEADRLLFCRYILHGVAEAMVKICSIIPATSPAALSPAFRKVSTLVVSLDHPLERDTLIAIKQLWTESEAIRSAPRFADPPAPFLAKLPAYMDKFDEIIQPGYVPTLSERNDCCQARKLLCEHRIVKDGEIINMIHAHYVNGDPRKWLHMFDDVQALLFAAPLTDYDQMDENWEHNKLVKALDDIGEYSNKKFFRNTPIILLLTKSDIFEQKVAVAPLNTIADFSDCDTDPLSYLLDKFIQRVTANSPGRSVYHRATCLTDNGLSDFVLDTCQRIKRQGR